MAYEPEKQKLAYRNSIEELEKVTADLSASRLFRNVSSAAHDIRRGCPIARPCARRHLIAGWLDVGEALGLDCPDDTERDA
jgi:hypothetical protein